MSAFDILPGYDAATGNTNSCLYRTYGAEACIAYDPMVPPLDTPGMCSAGSDTVVVHSAGFEAFLVAREAGLFAAATHLVVIDGWFSAEAAARGIKLPAIPTVFLFPTFGNRAEYPLESVVRQAMVTRTDIYVVRAVGLGHNLLFGEFGVIEVRALVDSLCVFVKARHRGAVSAAFVDLSVTFTSGRLRCDLPG